MKTTRTDDCISLRAPFGRISSQSPASGGSWEDGEVLTPYGIVSVYAEGSHSRLDFCYGGKLYMRNYPKRLTKRGMTMLAGRMAKEIAGA